MSARTDAKWASTVGELTLNDADNMLDKVSQGVGRPLWVTEDHDSNASAAASVDKVDGIARGGFADAFGPVAYG